MQVVNIVTTTEYYLEPLSEENFASPQAYVEYIELFFKQPLEDRLVSSETTEVEVTIFN